MASDAVCTNCGYHGPATYASKGSCLLELVLWMLMIVPGIIYTVWRRTAVPVVCPRCGSARLIPDNTPEAARILER